MYNTKKSVKNNFVKNILDIVDDRIGDKPKNLASSFNMNPSGTGVGKSSGNIGDGSTSGVTKLMSLDDTLIPVTVSLMGAVSLYSSDSSVSIIAVGNNLDFVAKAGGGTINAYDVSYCNTNDWYVSIAGLALVSNAGSAFDVLESTIGHTDSTGFLDWILSGDAVYSFAGTGSFCLQQGFVGYIRGKAVGLGATKVGEIRTTIPTKNSTTFICYNEASGLHNIDYTAVNDNTFRNNVILFEILNDGTNKVVVRENHPYHFPTYVSRYLHENLAIIIKGAGAILTAKGTTNLEIVGDDEVDDHGLEDVIKATVSIPVNYYYTNAAGKWTRDALTKTLPAKYNKAGTATAITAKSYGIYRVYVSKTDDTNGSVVNYFAVYDTSEYSKKTKAEKAITDNTVAQATNELMALELAQLGYVIVDSTGAIVDIIIAKSSLRGVYANNTTNQAKLVVTDVTNFDKTLSSADTTVQAALETLDENTVNLEKDQTIGGEKSFTSDIKIINSGIGGRHLVFSSSTSGLIGQIGGVYNGATNDISYRTDHEHLFYDNNVGGSPVFTIGNTSVFTTLPISGITPTVDSHLTTKKYVDEYISPADTVKEWHYHVSLTSGANSIGTMLASGDGALAFGTLYPDVPRNLKISINHALGTNAWAGTISLTGLDCNGATLNETLTFAAFNPGRVSIQYSNNAFIKLTGATLTKTNGAWDKLQVLKITGFWWDKVGVGNYPFSSANNLIFAKEYGTPATTFTLDKTYGTITPSVTVTAADIYTFLVKSR